MPSQIWRVTIESEDSFSEMLETSVAKSSDRKLARYVKYVEPGDGVCLTTYDPVSQTGRIRAVGIVLNVDKPSRLLEMRWAQTDFGVKPGTARRFWQKPYSRISCFDYLFSLFSENFPELLEPLPEDQKPKVHYDVEPDKYFKIEGLGCFENTPLSLIPHLGRIYTGAEWEAIGLCPYSIETAFPDGDSTWGHGSCMIDGYHYGFEPSLDFLIEDDLKSPLLKSERKTKEEWAVAIKQKKRHVQVPSDVYQLRRMSVSYDEISNLNEHVRLYAEGRLAMDRNDYPAAVRFFESALALSPKDNEYMQLHMEARVKSGDLTIIDDGLAYYINDMDCAAHCGDAESWLRLAMDTAMDHRLALDVALRVISGIEALIAFKTDKTKRIFGAQRIFYYKNVLDKFIKRLGTLRGFLSKNLVEANRNRAEELGMLLARIAIANPAKIKRIDELRNLLNSAVSRPERSATVPWA